MEDVAQPPQWMLKLENKLNRQHHRLAHEIGAGSPCIKCVDSCPGLDLHYWRKLCRNCKCKREDHDLADDAGSLQFEILLSKSSNSSNKLRHKKTVLDLDVPPDIGIQTKGKDGVTMDWVPPGVPVDLATEYMKKLPSAKVPISGSAGALYRRQQFEKQLPVHDLSPGLCHQLTPYEIDELNKYLTNLKSDVVGQGKVEKFSIIPHHPTVYSTALNVPSDKNIVHDLKKPYQFDVKNANSVPKPFVPYAGLQTPSNAVTSTPVGPTLNDPFHLKTPSAFLNNNRLAKGQLHNINQVGSAPPLIEENLDKDPSNNNEDRLPVSSGSQSSHLQLPPYQGTRAAVRSPTKYLQHSEDQRSADTYCVPQPLNQMKPNGLNQFKNLKINDSLGDCGLNNEGIGDGHSNQSVDVNSDVQQQLNCQNCHVLILPGEVVVSAERAGSAVYWHPQCFVCATCKELLVDLVYFYHKDGVYCGRHYAEKVNMLRCFACDELIFVKEYTMAEGKQFHIRHFCCFHCDTPLAGKEYIPTDDHPVCLDCYRKKYSKVCQTCGGIIEPVDKRVTIKDIHWHAVDDCFCCQYCKKPLANSKMVIDSRKPFCNKQCVLAK